MVKAFGPWKPNGSVTFAFLNTVEDLLPLSRLRPSLAGGQGRGLARLSSWLQLLDIKGEQTLETDEITQLATTAIEVTADEVIKRLPAQAGTCDPRDHLTGRYLREYNQHDVVLEDQPSSAHLPKACHRISHVEEQKLRRIFLDRGMTKVMPVKDIAVTSDFVPLTIGWFLVDEGGGKHRLISDRRMANGGERRFGWLNLPHGCLFARVRLEPDENLRGSGFDIKSFFHSLRNLDKAYPRNAVGRIFNGNEELGHGCVADEFYTQVLAVWAMGGINSADVAEQTLLSILQTSGVAKTKQLLMYGFPLPNEKVMWGVYLDDVCNLAICPRALPFKPSDHDVVGAKRAVQAVRDAGLTIAPDKSFGFAKDDEQLKACYDFVTWGAQVKGATGFASTEDWKRIMLVTLTARVLALRKVSKALLIRVQSLYTSPFMFRREFMCVFHRFFKFLATLSDEDLVTLPADIRDELFVALLLLPLAVADLRRPISNVISCTDATPCSGGACQFWGSKDLAKTLFRASEYRGQHVRLDKSDALNVEVRNKSAPLQEEPILKDICDFAPWVVSRSVEYAESAHVNLRELEEFNVEIRDMSRRSLLPEDQVNVADSQVSIGAWAKGRSSSFQINGKLRRGLGYRVVFKKQLHNLYADTKTNPADDPSRFAELRSPKSPVPMWLRPLLSSEPNSSARQCTLRMSQRMVREVFAGAGGLTSELCAVGLNTGVPMEAFPEKHMYVQIFDLDCAIVRQRLHDEIAARVYCFLHFGIPCKSWGNANQLNGGTRRKDCPDGGSNPLERELLGNKQAEYVAALCLHLNLVGGLFTIENPSASHLFRSSPFKALYDRCIITEVSFDQCAFGLRPPGASDFEFVKKPTTIIANFTHINQLSVHCPGISCSHKHIHAWGSRKVGDKRYSMAKAAGHYPQQLCQCWAQCVQQALVSLK